MSGPRPWSRRDALRLGSGAVAALAGCSTLESPSSEPSSTTTTTSTTTTSPSGRAPTVTTLSPPEKPESLTADSAVSFVERAERARVHDRLWRANVGEISLDCHAALHRETPGGFVVVAGCGGYASYPNGVADRGGDPAVYFLTPDWTARIGDPQRVERPEGEVYTGPEDATTVEVRGFRLYNLDTAAHALTVRLTHRDSGDVAFERTEEVAAGAGRHYLNLVGRAGTYRLELLTESGNAATYAGELPAGYGPGPLTGTLVPGGLALRREPAFEEIHALGPV